MQDVFEKNLEQSLIVHEKMLLDNELSVFFKDAVAVVTDALRNGNTVYVMGNGGSAADSQHLAAELMGKFKDQRKPFKAVSLASDVGVLTCIANDFGYEQIFARQVESLIQDGDVLIGFTTSGNSANVLEGFAANTKVAYNIVFTGEDGGKAKKYADIIFKIPTTDVARIQEGHQLLYHSLVEAVEQNL